MKIFKKLAVSIQANAENIAGKLENHEAVAQSMIADMEKSVAHARVHFMKVQTDRKKVESKLLHITKDLALWKTRARQVSTIDKNRAIECVKRVKNCQGDIARLENDKKELYITEKKLQSNLAVLGQKLAEIKRKKHSLSCRQSCVDALGSSKKVENLHGDDLIETFERWETDVMVHESVLGDHVEDQDELNEQFQEQEDNEELHLMLDEILSEQNDDKK